MGCSQSKQNGSDDLATLKMLLDDAQTSANEQQNLLRFKIEVLVNMLAMEEKKSESTNKRLETLKWLMHSQGVSEQTLTDILKNSEDIYNEKLNEGSEGAVSSNRGARLIDLSGAIARMTEDFKEFREEILHSFAEIDGKIVANLTTEEFSKQLYVVTDKVSKTDIHILSMRFSDGLGSVSIPEFLEFFTTPAQVRMAKAASAAVRMSLDLLQLEGSDEDPEGGEEGDQGDDDELLNNAPQQDGEVPFAPTTPNRSSHRTDKLESGVKKLVDLWLIVQDKLTEAFTLYEEPGQQQIVTVDIFKKTLTDICGKKSVVLRKAAIDAKTAESARVQSGTPSGESKTADPNGIATPKPDVSKSGTFTNPKKPPLATSKSTTSLPPSSGAAKLARDTSTSGQLSSSSESVRSTGAVSSSAVEILPLDDTDVNMLVARFELSGLIHCGHFIQYFSDLARHQQQSKKKRTRLPPDMSGISPFRLSSEWVSLRKSASINNGGQSLVGRDSPVTFTEPQSPSNSSAPPTPKDSLSLINPTSLKNGAPAVSASPANKKIEVPLKVDAPLEAAAKKDPAVIVEEKKGEEGKAPAVDPVPPVPTAEVVGFSCCGGRSRKPLPDAPIELPPIAADLPSESKVSEAKLSLDTKEEELGRPKDGTSFDTPTELPAKKRLDGQVSFRPKVVETGSAGGTLRREGLGLHHSDEETESDENKGRAVKNQQGGQARLQNARKAVESPPSNSRFHRRAEKSFEAEKKRNPLSDDEDDDQLEEINAQPANVRRK